MPPSALLLFPPPRLLFLFVVWCVGCALSWDEVEFVPTPAAASTTCVPFSSLSSSSFSPFSSLCSSVLDYPINVTLASSSSSQRSSLISALPLLISSLAADDLELEAIASVSGSASSSGSLSCSLSVVQLICSSLFPRCPTFSSPPLCSSACSLVSSSCSANQTAAMQFVLQTTQYVPSPQNWNTALCAASNAACSLEANATNGLVSYSNFAVPEAEFIASIAGVSLSDFSVTPSLSSFSSSSSSSSSFDAAVAAALFQAELPLYTLSPISIFASSLPHCEPYVGSLCSGVIDYPIYVSGINSFQFPFLSYGQQQALTEYVLTSEVEFLFLIIPKTYGCRDAFIRAICTEEFTPCNQTDQWSTAASDLLPATGTSATTTTVWPSSVTLPTPLFPCQSVCSEVQSTCSAAGAYSSSDLATALNLVSCSKQAQTQLIIDNPAKSFNQFVTPSTTSPSLQCYSFNAPLSAAVTATISNSLTCPLFLAQPATSTAQTLLSGTCALPCPPQFWTDSEFHQLNIAIAVLLPLAIFCSILSFISMLLTPNQDRSCLLFMSIIHFTAWNLIIAFGFLIFPPARVDPNVPTPFEEFGAPGLLCRADAVNYQDSSDTRYFSFQGGAWFYLVTAGFSYFAAYSCDAAVVLFGKSCFFQLTKWEKYKKYVWHAIGLIPAIVIASVVELEALPPLPFVTSSLSTANVIYYHSAVGSFIFMSMLLIAFLIYFASRNVNVTVDYWMYSRPLALQFCFLFAVIWLALTQITLVQEQNHVTDNVTAYVTCVLVTRPLSIAQSVNSGHTPAQAESSAPVCDIPIIFPWSLLAGSILSLFSVSILLFVILHFNARNGKRWMDCFNRTRTRLTSSLKSAATLSSRATSSFGYRAAKTKKVPFGDSGSAPTSRDTSRFRQTPGTGIAKSSTNSPEPSKILTANPMLDFTLSGAPGTVTGFSGMALSPSTFPTIELALREH